MRLFEIQKLNLLPLKSFKELWHTGNFDSSKKKSESHEGSGLSVTTHPEEWKSITQLSGKTWTLSKKNNNFIDKHALSQNEKNNIVQWGIDNKYIQYQSTYKVSWYDDDLDSEVSMEFGTKEEAIQEVGVDNIDDIREIKHGINMLPKLAKRTKNQITPSMSFDLLLTVYAEDHDYDGVWWEDNLDVARYSAPRGVIVPTKLQTWNKHETF